MAQSPLPPPSAVSKKSQPRRTFLQTLGTGALLAVIAAPDGRAAGSSSPSEPAPAPDPSGPIEPAYYADPGWSG